MLVKPQLVLIPFCIPFGKKFGMVKIPKSILSEEENEIIKNEGINTKSFEAKLPLKFGWGTGYVAINKTHPFYKKYNIYEEWESDMWEKASVIDVTGGITFSGFADKLEIPEKYRIPKDFWVIGFDTAHFYQEKDMWQTEESVMNEAIKLKEQLLQVYKNG